MKYRKLGSTDLKVSVICLGSMTWGEQNSEKDGHQQLDYAVEHGVNFVDTAELYAVPSTKENNGKTEEIIGAWLKHRRDRDQLVIATKVAGPSPNLDYIRNPIITNRAQILEAVEGSLRRLQTDYIDLYQLHWPDRPVNFFGKRGYTFSGPGGWRDNFHEVLETMKELKKSGKIRHFGISNETPWGLMHYIRTADKYVLPRVQSIQNPYNLLNRTYEVGLAEMSIQESVGLLAYSPMAFGLLSGKYHRGPEPNRGRLKLFTEMSRYNSENCYNATAEYLKIADKHNLSLAQMSLAFVNQQAFVTSNIIGATTMDQLKENIASIDIQLDKELISEIEEVNEKFPNPAP